MKNVTGAVVSVILILVGIGAMGAANDEPKYNPSQKEFT